MIILIHKEYCNIVKLSFAIFNVTLSMLLTMGCWNQQLRCKITIASLTVQCVINFVSFSYFCINISEKGLDHVAETILSYLDAQSLCAAELVSKEWYRVISEGMLWKKLIERRVRTDSLWKGLAERRNWYVKISRYF